MRIKEVEVSMGFTKNMGNYESARIDVGFRASLEPGEDPKACADILAAQASEEIEAQARRVMSSARAVNAMRPGLSPDREMVGRGEVSEKVLTNRKKVFKIK